MDLVAILFIAVLVGGVFFYEQVGQFVDWVLGIARKIK